ncbi:hypothetical protein AVEN_164498-1 [Araneus ventricosus]|uniref:Uncharacterized protein n=1 Tax=Araneus ventricosus TaxID=182803 RepID=A0A4Y2QIN8_ARAVE|nr:hypothetical protein AVEN_164498-1 [Araneus ventricosus]
MQTIGVFLFLERKASKADCSTTQQEGKSLRNVNDRIFACCLRDAKSNTSVWAGEQPVHSAGSVLIFRSPTLFTSGRTAKIPASKNQEPQPNLMRTPTCLMSRRGLGVVNPNGLQRRKRRSYFLVHLI